MNKKEQVREIFSALLTITEGKLVFYREQLENAIMQCRGCDKRTLQNWWRYLWRLEYFKQPLPERFQLNVNKLLELELDVPSINQTHLLP